MRPCRAILLLLCAAFSAARGGSYEEGRAAYRSGDFRRATPLLREAAEAGNPDAQCFLAAMCLAGQGQPVAREEGVKWFRRAAELGSALAWLNLGLLARGEEHGPEAVACLTKAADARADAAASLGDLYFYGEAGIARDYETAARWYTRGAEGGHAAARNTLGLLYEEGKGVPRDPARALELYRRAAEGGDRRAEANLGRMYYEGRGVPHDLMLARTWLSLSARHGEATGEKLLREFADKLSPEQIAETDRRAAAMDKAPAPPP